MKYSETELIISNKKEIHHTMGRKFHPKPKQPELTQPTYQDTGATVENVYDANGHDRDRTSQRRMSEYLRQRLVPRQIGARAVTISVADGVKNRYRLHSNGWFVSPKQALAGTLLGLGLLNGAVNAEEVAHNIGTAVQDIGDEVEQAKFGLQYGNGSPDIQINYPDSYLHDHVEGTIGGHTTKEVGSSTVDPAAIDAIVDQVKHSAVYIEGGRIVTIRGVGGASDEYGRDNGTISSPDTGNEELGVRRSVNDSEALSEALDQAGIAHPEIDIKPAESVLSPEAKSAYTELAQKYGYDDIAHAVAAYDNGDNLPAELATVVQDEFVSKRGTTFTIDIQKLDVKKDPGGTYVIPGVHPPGDPNRDYDGLHFLPLVIPPIPQLRLRRRQQARVKDMTFIEPGTPTWLHLYKEAMTEDGDLKNDLAFYTRKMNHLLRDDRIKHVETASVLGHDGAERAMRMCFVDQEPNEVTLDEFRKVLGILARANEGTLPDNISTIMVYPTENAGLEHNDPKRIGIGIDEQDPANVLGVTMPLLGLVELHMPQNPTDKQLQDFYGALWTLAHELGHGVDIDSTKPQELIRAADGSYVSRNTWRNVGAAVDQQLLPLDGTDTVGEVQFEIVRELRDRTGKIKQITEIVDADDPKLQEAIEARIIDRKPTSYGSTHSMEHTAEVAAAVATGIDIPFKEAGVNVPSDSDYNFAQGYRPAQPSVAMLQEETGIRELDRHLHNSRVSFRSSTVQDDPYLRGVAERARTTPVPNEDDMIRVLSWVIDRQNKPTA